MDKQPTIEIKPDLENKVKNPTFEPSPEEGLDSKGETKENKIQKMLSFVDATEKTAKQERTLREKIATTLKTGFSNTITPRHFFDEFRTHLKSWSEYNKIIPLTMDELKEMLEEAKKDNYQGTLGTKTTKEGEKAVYLSGEKTGRTTEATKVME